MGDSVSDQLSLMLYPSHTAKSTSSWLNSIQHETNEKCPDCRQVLKQPIYFNEPSHILAFDVNSVNMKLSRKIKFVDNDKTTALSLRGIIYHGDFHFTSRIVSSDGSVWFHDGMTSAHTTVLDGNIDDLGSQELSVCKGKKLVLALYSQVH
jgi:hypothetical protein